MAAYKRYRKEDSVSYSLGITLTFELLKFKTEYVNRVFVHSAMKQGDTLDKLLKLCEDSDIEVVYADKIFNVLSQKDNCYVIGEFRKFESGLDKDSSHIVLVKLHDVKPQGKFSLIFGNEATGLPHEFSKIGKSVIIPHSDRIDSLNLPIAASIAMYEATKADF